MTDVKSRILLVLTVYESEEADQPPRVHIVIGDGFAEHRSSIADVLKTQGNRWAEPDQKESP